MFLVLRACIICFYIYWKWIRSCSYLQLWTREMYIRNYITLLINAIEYKRWLFFLSLLSSQPLIKRQIVWTFHTIACWYASFPTSPANPPSSGDFQSAVTMKWRFNMHAVRRRSFTSSFTAFTSLFLSRLPSSLARLSLTPYISLFSLFLPLSAPFPFFICLSFSLAFLIGYALQ